MASDNVSKTIAAVRRLYERGVRSRLEHAVLPRKSLAGLTEDQQKRYRVKHEGQLKARTFANPARGFSRGEFQTLIKEFKRRHFALGTSLIKRLLGVPKGPKRDRLLEAALDGTWSWRELAAAIKRKSTARAGQGRTPGAPRDTPEALERIGEECSRWERWVTVLLRADEDGQVRLPAEVMKRLEGSKIAVRRLATAAAKVS